jgi:hypothetical protein
MSYASTVTILDLKGSGGVGRKLQLRGAGMPFRPAGWKGGNNIQTTWYPGNGEEATQQVLGPRELPSVWSGEWRYTWLSRTPAKFAEQGDISSGVDVSSPETLKQLFESLIRGGMRLRVIWEQSGSRPEMNAKIVREGRAKDWEFNYERAQDLAWSVTWEWQSRGRGKQAPVQTRDESLETKLALYRSKAESIIALQIKDIKSGRTAKQIPDQLTLGQLESLAQAPSAIINQVQQRTRSLIAGAQKVVDLINTIGDAPFSISNATLQLVAETVQAGNQFVDSFNRTPSELLSTKTAARDIIRAFRDFNRTTESVREFVATSSEVDLALRRVTTQVALQGAQSARATSNANDIITIHIAKEGETPTTLSLKYYGSPDNALDILRANNLPWFQSGFRFGDPIVIPNLSSQRAG